MRVESIVVPPLPSSIFFSGQNAYSHGTNMCTTACMHVAVGALCKLVDVSGRINESTLKSRLDSIMKLASRAQSCLEMQGLPRMLSAHELILECGIDLPKMGIKSQEVFVVDKQFSQSEGEAGCCFIDAEKLPSRLREKLPCAAVATGNGHTVCLIHYAENKFAVFDSLPGLLAVDLDERSLMRRLGTALDIMHLGSSNHASSSSAGVYRKGRKISFLDEVYSRPDQGSALKRNKKLQFDETSNSHQCDVTIFWKE